MNYFFLILMYLTNVNMDSNPLPTKKNHELLLNDNYDCNNVAMCV